MLSYLRARWRVFVLVAVFAGIALLFAWLYGGTVQPLLYPLLLCCAVGLAAAVADVARYRRHRRELADFLLDPMHRALPAATTEEEQALLDAVSTLRGDLADAANEAQTRYAGLMDYYTLWAHQIKTPIASMRLALDQQDSELARSLRSRLTAVDRYVDMAMTYLRLDSSANDYVLAPAPVDEMIRSVLRDFAGDFIAAKLKLDYQPIGRSVVTDRKWLAFVLGQLLSNAIKYTPSGSVRIRMEGDDLLIEDTGIGIAPEDVPRVFEKGYTGYNGRSHQKASGIGLFLCMQVCQKLGHRLSLTSTPGQGTTVRIAMGQYALDSMD